MKITIIIPAHNEERSIKATVESCLRQSRPLDQILVINDGSTDNTGKILATFGSKIEVVTIKKATGNKSHAQEYGLKYVRGDIFIATDGDTILDENFVEKIEPHFKNSEVIAVAGYVKSIKNNWLTACREVDYVIGQDLHKTAQANMRFLFVIPGCAGAFRTNIFRDHIIFDHDTLTEDLDFTYKMHARYFQIHYEKKAIVYTQDPFTLYAYINQMRRWYSGGWQNLKKHIQHMVSKPVAAMELSVIYFEGLMFSLLLFFMPFLSIEFFIGFLIAYFIFMFVVSAYAAICRKRYGLLFVAPAYLILVFINAYVFLEQFFREIVLRRSLQVWFKPERKKLS